MKWCDACNMQHATYATANVATVQTVAMISGSYFLGLHKERNDAAKQGGAKPRYHPAREQRRSE
jgi:hypothetical protein